MSFLILGSFHTSFFIIGLISNYIKFWNLSITGPLHLYSRNEFGCFILLFLITIMFLELLWNPGNLITVWTFYKGSSSIFEGILAGGFSPKYPIPLPIILFLQLFSLDSFLKSVFWGTSFNVLVKWPLSW